MHSQVDWCGLFRFIGLDKRGISICSDTRLVLQGKKGHKRFGEDIEDLKLNYYDPYENDAVRMAKKSGHIQECQFRELLKYWNSEKFKVKI